MELSQLDVLNEVKVIAEKLEQSGRSVRRFSSKQSDKIVQDYELVKKSSIVLKSDMKLELGGPIAGSCVMTICSRNANQIRDGEITIIGKDIQEMSNTSVPFAQIIMIAYQDADNLSTYRFMQYLAPPGIVDGFMIKNNREQIWCRVSKKAFQEGLTLQDVGSAIILHLKHQFPDTSVAIMFITSGSEDVNAFSKSAQESYRVYKDLKKQIWSEKDLDISSCTTNGHCGLCKNQKLCDTVRDFEKEYRERDEKK